MSREAFIKRFSIKKEELLQSSPSFFTAMLAVGSLMVC